MQLQVRELCVLFFLRLQYLSQGHTHLRAFSGTGADDDIVVSSVRAYVSAMNKLIAHASKAEKRAAEESLEREKSSQSVNEAHAESLTPA